jgi:hypothetical protein
MRGANMKNANDLFRMAIWKEGDWYDTKCKFRGAIHQILLLYDWLLAKEHKQSATGWLVWDVVCML